MLVFWHKGFAMRWFLGLLLVLGLTAGGVGYWKLYASGKGGPGFRTAQVERGDLSASISATGTIEPEEVVDLVRNRKIGFVFQSFNLLARTSALDNVIMPLAYTNSSLSSRECCRRGKALLERVRLGSRLDHEPSQLSG